MIQSLILWMRRRGDRTVRVLDNEKITSVILIIKKGEAGELFLVYHFSSLINSETNNYVILCRHPWDNKIKITVMNLSRTKY